MIWSSVASLLSMLCAKLAAFLIFSPALLRGGVDTREGAGCDLSAAC
jgi:hypothetical protein